MGGGRRPIEKDQRLAKCDLGHEALARPPCELPTIGQRDRQPPGLQPSRPIVGDHAIKRPLRGDLVSALELGHRKGVERSGDLRVPRPERGDPIGDRFGEHRFGLVVATEFAQHNTEILEGDPNVGVFGRKCLRPDLARALVVLARTFEFLLVFARMLVHRKPLAE